METEFSIQLIHMQTTMYFVMIDESQLFVAAKMTLFALKTLLISI